MVRPWMMDFEGLGKSLWSQTFTLTMMACTWWWSSIDVYLVIWLNRCWYDDAIEMSCLCEIWDYGLRCNDIRFVLKYLCALLWDNDVNVLISQMRVVLKGYSHTTYIELMTMTIQAVSLLWPKLSYDCLRKTFKKGLYLSTEWTSSEECPFPRREGRFTIAMMRFETIMQCP